MTRSKIRTSGADGLTLSSTSLTVANGLTLSDGNVTLASGHGLDFAATGDGTGSSQAEVLDDYEEGTWTPAISGLSLTILGATYTKIGNMVRLNTSMQMPSTSSSTAISFSGAPFASISNQEGAGCLAWSNAPYTDGIMIQIQSSDIAFYKNIGDSNAGVAWPLSNFTSSYIRFTLVYTTAS